MVTAETVSAEELEARIVLRKEEGKRILALSPSQLKKIRVTKQDYEVTHYVLVTM